MAKRLDVKLLQGRWLHSHEEDVPGKKVFRPSSHPLPPSRGRYGYEFHSDGHLSKLAPGPTDKSLAEQGTWTVDDQGRVTIRVPGCPDEVLEIDVLDSDRLIVK